jgi:hypothetical protein
VPNRRASSAGIPTAAANAGRRAETIDGPLASLSTVIFALDTEMR